MLLTLISLAWPCSYAPDDVSVVPGFGTLRAGTVLRVSSDGAQGELLDPTGQDTDLEARPIALGWTGLSTPEGLAEGDYELGLTAYTGSGDYDRRSYSFVAGPPGGALDGTPTLLEITHATGADPEDPCDSGLDQLVSTMTWELPAATEAGWVAQLVEATSGAASPFYSLEVGGALQRSLSVAQEPSAVGDICPELDIFNALHERVDGATAECVSPETGRCAAGGVGAGSAWLLGLAAALRRRR